MFFGKNHSILDTYHVHAKKLSWKNLIKKWWKLCLTCNRSVSICTCFLKNWVFWTWFLLSVHSKVLLKPTEKWNQCSGLKIEEKPQLTAVLEEALLCWICTQGQFCLLSNSCWKSFADPYIRGQIQELPLEQLWEKPKKPNGLKKLCKSFAAVLVNGLEKGTTMTVTTSTKLHI